MDEVDIVLDISPNMRAISESSKSFGEISKSRKSNDIEYGIRKKEQAQRLLPSVHKLSNIKFSEMENFQLPTGETSINVFGCTVLPEGLLLFTDSNNNRLIICDSDGTFKKDILTLFPPRYIIYINHSTVGLTSSSNRKVALVGLINGKELSSFSTVESCYGLSYRNEMLTIRITGSFITTTLKMEIKGTLEGAD
ncbi:unnamed protein product [Mytilus edulis]|uniref:Uncharacterized protein n=1 Tax=Mytilus edulis TaxID=6550 RepID=A0A8S3S9V6_MYTED|nr:unnamed protein product [Mytilus edulis]